MKIKSLLSIDYNVFYYFVAVIVCLFAILLFVTFIVFNITSEKYTVIKLSVQTILFFIIFIIFLVKIIIRINLIKKIIEHGITVKMEIIDSVNWPRDQYVCSLLYNDIIYKSILKVSKKNKLKLDKYCNKGNIVNVGFLENKKKNVILIDLYKIQG